MMATRPKRFSLLIRTPPSATDAGHQAPSAPLKNKGSAHRANDRVCIALASNARVDCEAQPPE
jgi:hypothetical protein